jgi:hypothetical protein
MSEVINLSDHRPPVTYEIVITHHWDDQIDMWVKGVADDPRSREVVRETLQRILDGWEDGEEA